MFYIFSSLLVLFTRNSRCNLAICTTKSNVYNVLKSRYYILFLLIFVSNSNFLYSQCINSSYWLTGTAPTPGNSTILSYCAYGGDYNIMSGAVAGQTYTVTSVTTTDFITITEGSSTGPVVIFGTQPLTFTPVVSGSYFFHISTNSSCGTDANCHEITVTADLVPCSGTPNAGTATISSATGCINTNFTLSASGITSGTGMTYQWQTATSASGPWSNISGATALSSSTSVASIGTTYYQLVSTCTNSGASATSSVVSYTAAECYIMSGSLTTVTTCSGTFYDSGGPNGDYTNNEVFQVTFYPSTPGAKVILTFTDFRTEGSYDGMMIYNGNSTSATLFSSGAGAGNNTTTCPAGSWRGNGANVATTYTSTASDGSITVVFRSDASTVFRGWVATISCTTPCTTPVPTGSATQTFCSSANPTIASLTATGTAIKWYSSATGGNQLASTVQLSNGATYYASQTISGCESVNRFAVTVTITPVPVSAAITGTATICGTGTSQLTLNYPTGGTISTSGGYQTHAFTSSGTLNVPTGFSGNAEVLVVAGGGGGGSGRGGGGGAGGLLYNSYFNLTAGTSYPVTVGAGGAAATNGNNSVFSTLNAVGGGRGGSHDGNSAVVTNNGQSGGSGGGAAINYNANIFTGGTATSGQGNNGATSGAAGTDDPRNTGGGGGAGQAGTVGAGGDASWSTGTAPKGGDGLYFPQFTAFGSAGWFAGGGGGSRGGADRQGAPAGAGGQGGGGAGQSTATGTSGTANTGGGGGGSEAIGGAGGSGVVLVYYYIGTGTWSSSNTAVATVDGNGLVTGVGNGTATISYTVAGSGSCPGSVVTYEITVTNNTAIAANAQTGCINTPLSFTINTSYASGIGTQSGFPNGVTASWSANVVTVSGTPTESGTFNYQIQINGNCNVFNITGTLTVNTITTASVGSAQSVCGLTSNALGGNTPTNGTGSWSIFSGGTGTFSSSTAPNATFTADAYGTYVLRWTISNAPCTPSTADVTVNFYQTPTIASVGPNQTICSTLTSNALGGSTPTVGTGAWSIVSGGTGTFSDAASPSSTFTATATGTYVLRWTITNGTCPVSIADITVLFAVTPTAGITGSNTFCSGSNTTLTASGGATYAWADGSGTSFGTNAISNTITAAGTYTVTVTSADGCTVTANQVVSVTPNVTPTFTQIQAQCQNTTAPVLATSSTNSPAITGTWSPTVISTTTVGSATYTFTPTAGICATTTTMTIAVVSCAQIAPCDILVYRIESGSTTSTNAAPISILEFDPNFVSSPVPSPVLVNAPTTNGNLLTQEAGNTANSPLTGYMNTYNGVTAIPGYRDAAGTSVTASDNEGTNIINANQSTALTNHSVFTGGGSFYRAVVPVDGTRFYLLGIGNTAATSGIFYYNGTSVVTIYTDATALTNPIRNIEIFNGQLYCSRKSTAANSPYIFAVGTGLPETTTTTLTGVANVAATTASPNDFSISPDGTTMFVADNASLSSNGITKFIKSANGGLFVKVGTTFTATNSNAANVNKAHGIAVDWSSTPIKIFFTVATSATATAATYLHSITESSGINVSATTWPATAAVNYYLSTSNSCTNCKYAGVDLAPTIATSVSSNGGCIGNPITVTASALQAGVGTLTYKWYKYTSSAAYVDYFGATQVTEGVDGTGSTTATFTPLLAGNYFCEISGTCAKFRTQRLVVTSPPTVTATWDGICSPTSTGDIVVTTTGVVAPFNVSWTGTASGDPVGTEIATSGGSYTIPSLSSGTYSVSVTSSNGCVVTPTSVTINCGSSCTNPTIDAQPTNITECLNEGQQLSVTATGATLTYQWYSNTTASNTGGTLLTGETNATFTPPSGSAGTFFYYVIVNSSTCATTSNAVTVVVNPNNTAGAPSSSPSICLGLAIPNVTIATSGATGIGTATGLPTGVSASWSGDVITISGTPSTTVGSPFTYTIPLSGGCGSVDATGTITVVNLPIITGTASTCINSTTQLTGSPTAAASNPWTSSNTAVATVSNTGLVTGVDAGTTTITYTNTDGCSVTTTVTISDILDWVNLQSPPSGTICVGGTFDIYGQFYNTGTVNTTINASAATGVTVEFGYSASNTNPNTWTNWSSATFNAAGGGANNDEYSGTFTGLPVGTYYYTFRYQINGCGWQYGGYSNAGGGFWDGTTYISGVLTVNTAPSILFISPP